MSANWYTLKWSCKDPENAKKLHQALLPFETEDHEAVVHHLNQLGRQSGLNPVALQDLEDFYPEKLVLNGSRLTLVLMGPPGGYLPEAFYRCLAEALPCTLKLRVFNDQVGEPEEEGNHRPVSILDGATEDQAIAWLREGRELPERIDDMPLVTWGINSRSWRRFPLRLMESAAWLPEDVREQRLLMKSAVQTCNLPLLERLQELGLDFSSTKPYSFTHWFLAVEMRHRDAVDVVRFLLRQGVKPSIGGRKGSLLWQMMASPDVTQEMLALGAKLVPPKDAYEGDAFWDLITAIFHNDLTKLHAILAEHNLETVFQERDGEESDLEAWDSARGRLINECAEHDRPEMLALILGDEAPDPFFISWEKTGFRVHEQETLLEYAVGWGAAETVALLVEHLPRQLSKWQEKVIEKCCAHDFGDIPPKRALQAALHELADRLSPARKVSEALARDDAGRLQQLWEIHGAEGLRAECHDSLLWLATDRDAKCCLDFLLGKVELSVEAQGADGNTALGRAVWKSRPGLVSRLLAASANPDTRIRIRAPQDSEEPSGEQCKNERREGLEHHSSLAGSILDLQEEYGALLHAEEMPALVMAAHHGQWDQDILAQLLAAGADVDAVDAKGRSALIVAVANEDAISVQMLLEAGAHRGISDDSGKTAMDYAEKRAEVFQELLAVDAG